MTFESQCSSEKNLCGAKGNHLSPHVILAFLILGPQRLIASMFWDAQFKVQVTIERESNDIKFNSPWGKE